MRSTRIWLSGAAAALLLAACGTGGTSDGGGAGGGATSNASCPSTTKVKLQLQWVAQSQFAGYYAAKDRGLWAKECLDVTIVEGG
ncbi:MAG: ABC transporter substrate-binding protein, partial [Lapillicoccus sp.]